MAPARKPISDQILGIYEAHLTVANRPRALGLYPGTLGQAIAHSIAGRSTFGRQGPP